MVDLGITKRIRKSVDFNFAIDNLFNKRYFETQNYFDSRVRPADGVLARIHGTPGYPFTITLGVTLRVHEK